MAPIERTNLIGFPRSVPDFDHHLPFGRCAIKDPGPMAHRLQDRPSLPQDESMIAFVTALALTSTTRRSANGN